MANTPNILAQLGKILADQAAVSADSNNSASINNEDKKPRRQLDPVTAISKAAKLKFQKLPAAYQNAQGKRYAVDLAIMSDKKHRYGDAARFWDDVEVEGRILDRAADLKKFCEEQQLDYVAVKQHLVIEGRGVMKDIVLNGIEKYRTLIMKFGDLLYDREKECPVKTTGNQHGQDAPMQDEKEEGANA